MENNLFNEKTIQKLISNVKITSKQKQAVNTWLKYLEEGKLENEKNAYLEFADTILKNLLNYDTSLNSLKHEELHIEFLFKKNNENLICFEAKGAKTKDLWAYQGRDKKSRETPVNQINSYMYEHKIPFGILTNYRLFVLFDRNEGQSKYHIIDFTELTNENKLKEFVGLFSREQVEKGFITEVIKESIVEEREFTKEFYKLYHETRLMLIKEFEDNSEINRIASVHFAQLYLNRLMFIFFAEDSEKLNKKIIEERIIKTLETTHLFSSNSTIISNVIIGLFNDLDKGSEFPVKIFGFNGGLFKSPIPPKIYFKDFRDEKFFKDVNQNSNLKKKDLELNENEKKIFEQYKNKLNPIIKNILLMDSFDFNSEVNVNILGHIFEQSLSDLENLKDEENSRRKKEGIFYTPEYITDYICRNTIIPYLSKKGVNSTSSLIKEYADNIGELETKFKQIKILDPACGSGAFLIKATDIMLEIFREIQNFKQSEGEYDAKQGLKRNSDIEGQFKLAKWNEEEEAKKIIQNNIYGVDINDESVEITKLSLFLKMASKNKKLTDLSNNIKQGNSLIDDKEVAGDLAFNWNEQFADVMNNGGFDIVIGNPPYVNIANISDSNIRKFYQSNYKTVKNKSDLYSIFTEKGFEVLKSNGTLSFIFSNSWLGTDSFSEFRKFLVNENKVTKLVKLPPAVFQDATVTAVIIILIKIKTDEKHNIELYELNNDLFQKMKHKLSYNRIINASGYTFSFEPEMKFNAKTIKLGEIAKFSLGIKTSNDERFILDSKKDEFCYPVLRGKDISRYYSGNPKKFIWYKPELMMEKVGAGPRHLEYFLKPKLFIQDVAKSIIICFDDKNTLSTDTLSLIYDTHIEFKLKYLLALLNSSFINKWFKNNFPEGLHIKTNQLQQIPIPRISLDEQKPFIEKADLMLSLNKEFYEKREKFFTRIKKAFNLEAINRKLEEFYNVEFNEFVKEIEKQTKIKISLKEQDEWDDYFKDYKIELLNLKEKISKIDNEINQMVYKLYGLTEEEIKLVEESLK